MIFNFVKGWLKLGLAVGMGGPKTADELAWGGTFKAERGYDPGTGWPQGTPGRG